MLMNIQPSQAGTIESNDILIILNPAEIGSGIKIDFF
ncbi:MAG: citrate lyase acyl carrier protein [Firmicutes bacterium]|nr:citrate lyase acyl carrier protein [Bacillota bacterium]